MAAAPRTITAAVAALALLAWPAPQAAAQPSCAAIADREARLACFDRATARTPRGAAPGGAAGGACTRASPCVGPRGGVYYFTASGNKRYLPR
jgi:hypothetical protein